MDRPSGKRHRLYVDMDNVLVDFQSGIDKLDKATRLKYKDRLDEVPGIFELMGPKKGAVEGFRALADRYEIYVLSTAPWENPSAWRHKLEWVKKHLGKPAHKRLILTHHKNLNVGDYLIDDRTKNGVDRFGGIHIHFGTRQFPDWAAVLSYLMEKPKRASRALDPRIKSCSEVIQAILRARDLDETNPVEAARWLDAIGVLSDSSSPAGVASTKAPWD